MSTKSTAYMPLSMGIHISFCGVKHTFVYLTFVQKVVFTAQKTWKGLKWLHANALREIYLHVQIAYSWLSLSNHFVFLLPVVTVKKLIAEG